MEKEFAQYKYYPHLSASQDMLKGGWILHLMAPTGTDRYDDYRRCRTIDTRYARVMALTENDYIPKYDNWYGLHFPLLHVDVIGEYGGSLPHEELPEDIRAVSNIAEKHLLMDQIFEKWVYDKTGRFKNEWDTFTSRKQGMLLVEFDGRMRATTV